MINSKTLFIAVLLSMYSCNSQNSALKSPDLQAKFDSLQYENKILAQKNDSLTSVLSSFKKKNGLDKQINDESDKVLLKYKLALTRAKTGYFVSDYENLFLPAITLEFKNLSQDDSKDDVLLDVYFINNKTGEQFSTDYNFFIDSHKILMGGLTKQVTLKSKIGWNAIQTQNISVRLYINNQFFKQYKIENTEYHGRF